MPHSNSGRCWLFAQCNVIRTQIMAQYDLDKFELSQSYRESRAWHSASVQA
jgi:aminopeptidase C